MKRNNIPAYEKVRTYLLRGIHAQRFLPGAKLPTEKELIAQFKVSITTIRKAIEMLCAEGLLVKQQGRGTFVREVPRPVGVVLPYIGPSWAGMVEALRAELKENSCRLCVYTYPYTGDLEVFLEQVSLCCQDNQGVIVFPPYHDSEAARVAFEQMRLSGCPVLFIDRLPGNMRDGNLVTVDYAAGFGRLYERLARTQKKIVLLHDPSHSTSPGLDKFRKAGKIPGNQVLRGPFVEKLGAALDAFGEILAMRPRPDAIIAPASEVAKAAVACLVGNGIAIPREIEVAAAGNLQTLGALGIPMWGLKMPRAQMGRAAARMMAELLDHGNQAPTIVRLQPEMVFIDGMAAAENAMTTKGR